MTSAPTQTHQTNLTQVVIKKFQYGAGFGQIENESVVVEQMRARNFLRNELVALDRSTREKYNAILNADNAPHERIQAINDEIKGLRAKITLMRVPKTGEKAGKHRVSVGPCVEKELIIALKKEKDDLKPVCVALKQTNKQKNRDSLGILEHGRKQAIKALYNRAIVGYLDERTGKQVPPLYNLNADEIRRQHDAERARAMKDKTELRFHSFVGEGRSFVRVHAHRRNKKEFGQQFMPEIRGLMERRKAARDDKKMVSGLTEQIVELQRQANAVAPLIVGQSEEETFSGESTLFKIEPVKLTRDALNPTVWEKSVSRAERRRRMQTMAHVRIQSDEKHQPIWIVLPIMLHRPFPCGARILSAAVNRHKIGSTFRWNVEFTVKYEETVQETICKGIVAVDLGWAKESLQNPDGRIRIAGVLVRDENEKEAFQEYCLPPSFHLYQQKLNDIHSIRDAKTNEAFAAVDVYRHNHEIPDDVLRNLLDEAKRSQAARKSSGKEPPVYHLRRAVWMLRKQEVKGDVGLCCILEEWYKRWKHLNEWLTNGRDNLLAHKKDCYRRWAHHLSQHNALLLLDADNFAKMAKTPNPEEDKRAMKGSLRQAASPGMLRDALTAAFQQTLWATIASSRTCRHCQAVNEQLHASRLFQCANCGYQQDREWNATGNLMDAYLRKPGEFSSSKKVSERLAERKGEEAIADQQIAQKLVPGAQLSNSLCLNKYPQVAAKS